MKLVHLCGYGLDDRGSILGRDNEETFVFATKFRTALEPTQPPTQWVPGKPCPGNKVVRA